MSLYVRTLGIIVTLILLGSNGLLVMMLGRQDLNKLDDLMPWIVSVVLTFFGLHYVTLTSFGFTNSQKQLKTLPILVSIAPYAYLLAASIFIGFNVYKMNLALKMLSPLSYEDKKEVIELELSLADKLHAMSLEKDFRKGALKWSFESVKRLTIAGENISNFYDDFGLSSEISGSLLPVRSSYSNNLNWVVLPSGRKISVQSSNRKVKGYYSAADVLVLQWRDESNGILYESIETGDDSRSTLEGIPLIPSQNGRYFADLRLLHKSNGVDMVIGFWKKNNGKFTSLGRTSIPFGKHHNSINKCELVNLLWNNNVFQFCIIEHKNNNNNNTSAFTTVEVEIID